MKKLIVALLAISTFSCSNESTQPTNNGSMVVISQEQFLNAPTDPLIINSLEIIDDNIKINFSSSGCNGDTWVVKLIDSEAVLESIPPQRNLKLSLENKEVCQAVITRDLTIDISSLQVDGNQVELHFVNSDLKVLYEY